MQGTIVLEPTDSIALPDCTVLTGSGGGGSARGGDSAWGGGGVRGGEGESDKIEDMAKTAKLVWKNPGGAIGINCGMKNSLLIGAEGRVTIRDLAIEAVALRGCAGIIGALHPTNGLTVANVNVTALAAMHTHEVFASPIQLRSARCYMAHPI